VIFVSREPLQRPRNVYRLKWGSEAVPLNATISPDEVIIKKISMVECKMALRKNDEESRKRDLES